MALQYSTSVRNARLDAIETAIGTSAILKIFDGTKPSDCATADAGTGRAIAAVQQTAMQLDQPAGNA